MRHPTDRHQHNELTTSNVNLLTTKVVIDSISSNNTAINFQDCTTIHSSGSQELTIQRKFTINHSQLTDSVNR